MNYYFRSSDHVKLENELVQLLQNSFTGIVRGVKMEPVDLDRVDGNLVFRYNVRRVTLTLGIDEGNYWIKLERGTKGSIETQYDLKDPHDLADAGNVILNWLFLQEFSSDPHLELRERIKKENAKYD